MVAIVVLLVIASFPIRNSLEIRNEARKNGKYVGTWEATTAEANNSFSSHYLDGLISGGILSGSFTLELTSSGESTLTIGEAVMSGLWERAENGIVFKDDGGEIVNFTINGNDELSTTIDGITFFFEK